MLFMGTITRQSFKGTIINFGAAFLGAFYLLFLQTKFLTAQELGLFQVFIQAALVMVGFAKLGMQSSMVRYFPQFQTSDNKHKGFSFWVFAIPTIGLLLTYIVLFVFKTPIKAYYAAKSPVFNHYYYLIILLVAAYIYIEIAEIYCAIKQRIVVPKILKEWWIRILNVIFILLFGFQVISFSFLLFGFIFAHLSCAIADIVYLNSINKLNFGIDRTVLSRKLVKDFTWFTTSSMVTAFLGIIVSRLDFLMLTGMNGLGDTAIYAIAFSFIALIELPNRSLMQMATPQISKKIADDNKIELERFYKKTSHNQVVIGILMFGMLWLNLDLIYHLLPKGELYSTGKNVVLFIGFAKILEFMFSSGGAILSFSKLFWLEIPLSIINVLVGLTANYLLIPIYGVTGAAMGTALVYFVAFLFGIAVLKIGLKISPFSKDAIVALFFICILIALIHFILINDIWLASLLKTTLFAGASLFLIFFTPYFGDLKEMISKLFNRLKNRNFSTKG